MPFWSIALRPVEWTLTGLGVVGCLYAADQFEVLPIKGKIAGVEVEFPILGKQVIENDVGIRQLRTEMDKLKWDLGVLSDHATSSFSKEKVLDLPMDTLTVSDNLLAAEAISGDGVIWLGTWDPDLRVWGDKTATTSAGKLPPPDGLSGKDVTLTDPVNVRSVLPTTEPDYYRDVPVLGVARPGTVVRIEEATLFERPIGRQYWARVTIDYFPKLTLDQAVKVAEAAR